MQWVCNKPMQCHITIVSTKLPQTICMYTLSIELVITSFKLSQVFNFNLKRVSFQMACLTSIMLKVLKLGMLLWVWFQNDFVQRSKYHCHHSHVLLFTQILGSQEISNFRDLFCLLPLGFVDCLLFLHGLTICYFTSYNISCLL